MNTTMLVLAAGLGSRFGGVKQLAGVGPSGEAILEYSVYDALAAGFDEVVFLIRGEIEADFRSVVLSRLPASLPCRLAFQEVDSLLDPAARRASEGRTKPWGTGHAVLCAEGGLPSPFAVINADDFYGRRSFFAVQGFLAASEPRAAAFCMAGYGLSRTTSPHGSVSRGICELGPGGLLRSVTEHVDIRVEGGRCLSLRSDGSREELPPDSTVSMNLWGFTPALFPLARPRFEAFLRAHAASPKDEFYLPGLVDGLIREAEATVRVLPTPESWFGLTHREDLAEVRSRMATLCEAGIYPSPLWAKGLPTRPAGSP
jgi:NDP-sugar pyrophosphorylase family protein